MAGSWTVGSVLDWTAGYFERGRIGSPRLDAELLLATVLGCSRMNLLLKKDEPLSDDRLQAYKRLITERSKRKPLQYITGSQEFMGLSFKVNRHVLIPRPETEHLVEEVVRMAQPIPGAILADIGTGSGNIPISIARHAKVAKIYATDISMEALAVAHENVVAHGCAGIVTLKQGDLFEALAYEGLERALDGVISNPPYIAEREKAELQPELSFEPDSALFGGPDGLEFYRRIAAGSLPFLKKGGFLALELNAAKAAETAKILAETGSFAIERVIRDYSGHERVMIARAVR